MGIFEESRTSKLRMIHYAEPGKTGPERMQYLNCQEAVAKMEPYYKEEKGYYAQQDLLKHLPATYNALTKLNEESEDLIGQMLMICYLKGELNGLGFAKARANEQQKSTYQVMGALASNSLITMRAVLEAIIYASLIFVIPMSLLPGGIKFFSSWLWTLIWIQMWPPFYVILNYIMQSVAQGYSSGIFMGLSESQKGISIFTSIGLTELHEDIYALSGYLSASIPFISYAILKGGVSSFMQLAGSMMTPAHTAAGAAASEVSTGNYSFASTGFGGSNYKNETEFQSNLAPSLSTGYYSENTGSDSTVYASNEAIFKQNRSELRTGVSLDVMSSQSHQHMRQEAESLAENSLKGSSESISSASRKFSDFNTYLSEGKNYSENISEREASSIQDSSRYLMSASENWGKQYGFSAKDSMDITLGLSFGGSGSVASTSALSDDSLNTANSLVNSEEFQSHFQKVSDFAYSKSASSLNDEGKRYAEGLTESLDQAKQHQESYQFALNKLEQISSQESWMESQSEVMRKSLDQAFINWSSDKYSESGGFARVKDIIRHDQIETDNLIFEFLAQYQGTHDVPTRGAFDQEYADFSLGPIQDNTSSLNTYKDTFKQNVEENYNDLIQRKQALDEVIDFQNSAASHRLHDNQVKMDLEIENARQQDSFSRGTSVALRACNKTGEFAVEGYQQSYSQIADLVGSNTNCNPGPDNTPLFTK